MDYYKVKDHSDLVRDPKSGYIINVNSIDYQRYIANREVRTEDSQKVENVEQDLANLKSEISEIKSLLKELVNGN